ncbi:MAG TPA: hypothetical protein VFA07_07655 [Chthonomonadaceae bacterium]|nr:hypothetical protein [Chthonomonadaceae bacterium]
MSITGMNAVRSVEPPVVSGWESERDTERAKVNARWIAIVLLFGVLQWIRRHTHSYGAIPMSDALAYGITGAALAMTTLEALYLWTPGRAAIPRWLKYVTVLGDMVFVSVLIYYTGFTQSPFFFVYFVLLISNCLRYGLLMSLFVAAAFNILYAAALGSAPAGAVHPSVLGGEGLKILAFWAVALYGGAVSARLRRQANQLRVYEETILDLRARLGEATAARAGGGESGG